MKMSSCWHFCCHQGFVELSMQFFLDSVGYKCNLGPLLVVSGDFCWHNNRLTNTDWSVSILFVAELMEP
jgi:hypothetical protein